MWHTTPIGVFRERLIGYVLQTKSYKQKGRLKTELQFSDDLSFTYTIPTLSFSPVFLLTGLTYARIEAVGRIEFAVELLERRFGLVQMSDVVFGRILRAALV